MATMAGEVLEGWPESEAYAPVVVADIDLRDPVSSVSLPPGYRGAHVLVRFGGEALGVIDLPTDGSRSEISAREILDAADASVGGRIRARCRAVGMDVPSALPADGLPLERSLFLEGRQELLQTAPAVTVVIPSSGGRVDEIRRCIGACLQLEYPEFEVIIVDNAPHNGVIAHVADDFAHDRRFRRVAEPAPGVSAARNRGIREAAGEIVAFIDDDEVPDPHWLSEVWRGFNQAEGVECVTGAMLPMELTTDAQLIFEALGGFQGPRGLIPALFGDSVPGSASPVYPAPSFGAGGNQAFKKTFLDVTGHFDPILGPGRPSAAGEDFEFFTRVLLKGGRISYWPNALTWHQHRRTLDELYSQYRSYGIGCAGYYLTLITRRPRALVRLVRDFPQGWHRHRNWSRPVQPWVPDAALATASSLHREGMLAGPRLYLRSLIQGS